MLRVPSSVSASLKSACIRVQGRGMRQQCCRYCTKTEPAVPQGSKPVAPAPQQTPTPPPPPPVQPPPPPQSGGSGGLLKLVGVTVLLTGGLSAGALAYAKSNPEFREHMEHKFPFLLNVLPVIFQETSESAGEAEVPLGSKKPSSPLAEFKSQLQQNRALAPSSTSHPTGGDDDMASVPGIAAHDETQKPATKKTDGVSKKELLWKKQKEEQRAQQVQQKLNKSEQEEAANVAAYEAIINGVTETSAKMTEAAIESQKVAVEATDNHTQKLKIALDEPTTDSEEKEKQWQEVVTAAEIKLAALTEAQEASIAAQEELQKLQAVIEESKTIKIQKLHTSPSVISAEESLKMLTYDLRQQMTQVMKSQTEAKILKEYHELIEEGKQKFKQELESIMPDVKLGKKDKKLSEDELNSLIAHAHRRIEQLQQQLAEQQTMETKRFAAALQTQREADAAIMEAEMDKELDRQASDQSFDQQKKLADQRREHEEEMRMQLKRQASAHSDHLQEVLRIQVKEFEEELRKQEDLVREDELYKYQEKMVECLAKLRGIENAIEGHADSEKQSRRSHELWLACETFKRTIATGKPEGRTMEGKLKPLASEVVGISESTENNPFVNTIVAAIPETALTRGVYNKDLLRERWQTVRKSCEQVAMVGEEGGTLFQYFLSYFQSLLLFTDPAPPKVDEEIDVQNLDTAKLLSYANYYVEQGDLEQAVKYVNLLSGMPRHVSADWVKEAKLLLETNQAATALSAHASAAGLGGVIL